MSPAAAQHARRHSPADEGERLVRILDHERRTGYADRAVIGGLDALIKRLADGSDAAKRMRDALPGGGYAGLGQRDRAAWITDQMGNSRGNAPPRRSSRERPAAAPRTHERRGETDGGTASGEAGTLLAAAGFGLKPKQVERFAVLGIETVHDALRHWPFRYHDFSRTLPIRQLAADEEQAVIGVIVSAHARQFRNNRGLRLPRYAMHRATPLR